MLIQDLAYYEPIAEQTLIEGGGDVVQVVGLGQFAFASVGGATRNSIGNTALGLNLAFPTLIAVAAL